MARRSIPQYDPAARGSYIPDDDSAVDRDRIDLEAAKLKDPAAHPWARYLRGETRFDLDAEMQHAGQPVRARDYLRPDEVPEVFKLRRLDVMEWNDIQRIDDFHTKALRACRLGVSGTEDSAIKIVIPAGSSVMTMESLQALADADPGLPYHLGAAVINFNRAPTDAEKKR